MIKFQKLKYVTYSAPLKGDNLHELQLAIAKKAWGQNDKLLRLLVQVPGEFPGPMCPRLPPGPVGMHYYSFGSRYGFVCPRFLFFLKEEKTLINRKNEEKARGY